MYDQFVGKCPACEADFSIQTKIDRDLMADIGVGGRLMNPFTMRLRLKKDCGACSSPIVAVIDRGLVERFEGSGEDHVEGGWGVLSPKGNARKASIR
jgi:hypothetical protein